jgi:hypothetical protein
MERQMNPIIQPTFQPAIHSMNLYLNAALCQSPSTISKTQKAIDYIRSFGSIGRFQSGIPEHGVHHMTFVLTNRSLSEASQWTVRLNNKLGHLNTIILSSKKDSDVRSMDQFWARIMRLNSVNDLPDLVVMCSHEKRTSDLLDMIVTLKKKQYDLSRFGIHYITLSIMFDEADANARLIVDCLNNIWQHLTIEDEMKDTVIRDIHFITATPLDDFWKQLAKCGIKKLKNVNHALQSMDKDCVLAETTYEDLMKQYRWLTDHKIDHSNNDMTRNPIDYARSFLLTWGRHNPAQPRIVFAPADFDCQSHYNMRDAFLSYGYWVYVDNGEKGKGKGFYNPQCKFQSVEDFRRQHNINGEPYETFRKWRELYPTESLAITGWLTIIRGITFNTTGFNFTNMILSACHMKNLADLLQVAGRADGDKKYVGIFTIHTPQPVWELITNRIELMAELYNKNPEEFQERDFRPRTKRDIMEMAMTKPKVIPITPEEYASVTQKRGREYDREKFIATIQRYDSSLAEQLKGMAKKQITLPEKEASIKKHITDFIHAAENDKKYTIDITKDEIKEKKDLYQIFIDKTEGSPKLIVSIFLASKIDDEE